MNISKSFYSLSEKRKGALLRFEFEEGLGYADCHPWTELGDLSLEEQLRELNAGKFTALTARSFQFARLDARARAEGRNLFQGIAVPRSHFLVTDSKEISVRTMESALLQGFDRIKLKVGRVIREEIRCFREIASHIPSAAKIRLDFNALLSEEELFSYLDSLGNFLDRVDFLEDPLKWDELAWSRIRARFGVRLALDREWEHGRESFADTVVTKPATQEIPRISKSLVVTSYLDHPFGQVTAAFEAGRGILEGRKIETCGLLSHRVYPKNKFSDLLESSGPEFNVPPGFGFGFDELLRALRWEPI